MPRLRNETSSSLLTWVSSGGSSTRWSGPLLVLASLDRACKLLRRRARFRSLPSALRPLPRNSLRASSASTREYQTSRSASGCKRGYAHGKSGAARRFRHRTRGLAVRPAGHDQAGTQPFQVPLPGTGVGLVEIVEVEEQVALGLA